MSSSGQLPPGWRTCRLGDLVEIFDGPHATPAKTDKGPIFLGIASLIDGRLDLSDVARLSEEDFVRWTRRITPRPSDVVFSYETRLGEAALVPRGLRCCLGRRMGLLRVRSPDLNPQYLLYAYLGPHFQRVIRDRTIHGSTVDRIPLNTMGSFPIVLPPADEQERIVSVLGALDDNIDSNRRLAQLLDETAATIFRARFVHFIGAEDVDESEIGPIPQGWRWGDLGDLATVTKQSVQPSDTPEHRFAHYGIPAFDANRRPEVVSGAELLSGKTALPPEDCVLLSKLNPATKRVWWPRPTGSEMAVCSPEFVVLVPRDAVPTTYLYAVVAHDERFYAELLGHVSGTTGSRQRVKPGAALECPALFPSSVSLQDWDLVARPLYDHAAAALVESATLAGIRDALLPKLTSGEIRVPDTADAAELIEPATETLATAS